MGPYLLGIEPRQCNPLCGGLVKMDYLMGRIDIRLAKLGIELPSALPPRAAHIKMAKVAGIFLFVSGQLPS